MSRGVTGQFLARGAAVKAALFTVTALGAVGARAQVSKGPKGEPSPAAAAAAAVSERKKIVKLWKGDLPGRLERLPARERQGVELMQRMVLAGLTQPFIAREVSLSSNGHESEQWVRWDPRRGMRRESIRPEGGELLLDNFDKAYLYAPKDHRWVMRDSVLPRPQGRIGDVMHRLYKGELHATVDGQDTIAGRPADIVRVGPPSGKGGPSRRFWIDRMTGIRLRMEEVAPNGRVLSSAYYLNVDLTPSFRPDDFNAPDRAIPVELLRGKRQKFANYAEASQRGFNPKQPNYLPGGFTLRQIEAVGDDIPRARVTQRFANGLTVLSLTQAPIGLLPKKLSNKVGANALQGVFVPGPRGGGERAYIWTDGMLNYALLGTLPDDEMRKIATSVR